MAGNYRTTGSNIIYKVGQVAQSGKSVKYSEAKRKMDIATSKEKATHRANQQIRVAASKESIRRTGKAYDKTVKTSQEKEIQSIRTKGVQERQNLRKKSSSTGKKDSPSKKKSTTSRKRLSKEANWI